MTTSVCRIKPEEAAAARRGEPITVLYLIDTLAGIGGAETALLNMLRALPRERFRPIVGTFKCDPAFPALANFPAPLHVLPLRRTYDLNAVRMALRLRTLIRREKVRIVHTFFETSDLWGGIVAKLSGRTLLVSSRRDMGIQRTWKHRLPYRLLGRMFDQVHTVSEKLRRETIEGDGIPPERVVTVYNGVDTAPEEEPWSSASICDRLSAPPDAQIVVTVCNVRPIKGVDVLLRAADVVCRSRRNTIFVIVGNTPDAGYLRELCELRDSLGLAANVRFWGPERSVQSVLRAADVFTLLSNSEGFSNALIEAMACGLPCVVTDVGGNREAIADGQCGYVVPRGDHNAAAARIGELLADADARRQMGSAASAVAHSRFTTTAMMQRLTTSYDALVRRQIQPLP